MQKRLACGVKAQHDLRHGKENTVTIEELYELIGGNYEAAMGVMRMEKLVDRYPVYQQERLF